MINPRERSTADDKHDARWRGVVFVCSKCMKRQDRDVRDELKHALRKRDARDVRVVACSCLDLCPDDGITIAVGDELAASPPQLRVISRKQPVDELADELGAPVHSRDPSRK